MFNELKTKITEYIELSAAEIKTQNRFFKKALTPEIKAYY